MKLLFIGAHPDDIEFGCGGVLSKHRNNCSLLIMTNGDNEIRKNEQDKSNELSGVGACYHLVFKDGYLHYDKELVSTIDYYLDLLNPEIVFVHHPEDYHQDHCNLSYAVKSSVYRKRSMSLVYYQSWSSVNFNPNYYIDISKYEECKRNLINCFSSQVNKYSARCETYSGKARFIDSINGTQIKCDYAECYYIDKLAGELL